MDSKNVLSNEIWLMLFLGNNNKKWNNQILLALLYSKYVFYVVNFCRSFTSQKDFLSPNKIQEKIRGGVLTSIILTPINYGW